MPTLGKGGFLERCIFKDPFQLKENRIVCEDCYVKVRKSIS